MQKKIKDPNTLEIEEWSPVDFRHNFKELDENKIPILKNQHSIRWLDSVFTLRTNWCCDDGSSCNLRCENQ